MTPPEGSRPSRAKRKGHCCQKQGEKPTTSSSLVVQWLEFGAFTAAARVRLPVRETFWAAFHPLNCVLGCSPHRGKPEWPIVRAPRSCLSPGQPYPTRTSPHPLISTAQVAFEGFRASCSDLHSPAEVQLPVRFKPTPVATRGAGHVEL